MAYVVFLFVALVVIAVFPAIAEARYDEVYVPTVESTDLTVPSYKVADEIDPVAIVTYTLQKEVEDAEAKANGETPSIRRRFTVTGSGFVDVGCPFATQ